MANNEIVPMCLYTGTETTYTSLPQKTGGKKYGFSCPNIPGQTHTGTFYTIHPDFRPIPAGTILLGMKNIYQKTTGVNHIYDPFNYEEKYTRFIAWIQPVPHSTPLYIYKRGDDIVASFDHETPKGYSHELTVYVLTDPRDGHSTVEGFTDKTFHIVNDQPVFTFTNFRGRCLPHPEGNLSMQKCTVTATKNLLNIQQEQPSLLTYLSEVKGKKKFELPTWFISVVIIVFLLSVSFLLIKNLAQK